MELPRVCDVDYLTARLHGRRSGLAEGGRLDLLCRLHTLPELGHALYPGIARPSATALQRRLLENLAREMAGALRHLPSDAIRLLDWLLVRLQVENLKVLLRGVLHRANRDELQPLLLELPRGYGLDADSLLAADTPADFAARIAPEPLRRSLQELLKAFPEGRQLFFSEAALDRGYFCELLARLDALRDGDRPEIAAVLQQEVDTFHLMVVVRGRFVHELDPGQLLPLHVDGTALPHRLFADLLHAPDLAGVARRVGRRALDTIPAAVTAVALEAAAWQRYWRLANRAFRRSHMGLGAVVGYFVLRRIEVANLITLSEGLRLGVSASALRARMLPRSVQEVAHV